MQLVLFDNAEWRIGLYPLTLTRPAADLRVGILTIAEKWAKWLQTSTSFLTAEHLSGKFSPTTDHQPPTTGQILLIKGNCCPDERLVEAVANLRVGDALVVDGEVIAKYTHRVHPTGAAALSLEGHQPIAYQHPITQIRHPEDLFINNGEQIRLDFNLLTNGRVSASLAGNNRFLGDEIFVEEGAKANFSTFNSLQGPIYLGKDSEVWEGSMVRGAFALGEGAQLKMGTKVYNNVTVGPFSRAGGELNTAIIWGNSAKGHDGYLGCSVIGEWCNWGADSNNSNLKNNYKPVRMFDYALGGMRQTGLQFCGMVMADHAKCAINTAFGTGTVVGVGANVFGGGAPPTVVPDFAWGGSAGFDTYRLDRFLDTAEAVYSQRSRSFETVDQQLLTSVFELTTAYRTF